jgi:hypothetical protein
MTVAGSAASLTKAINDTVKELAVTQASMNTKVTAIQANQATAATQKTTAEGYRDTAATNATSAAASLATVKSTVVMDGIPAISGSKMGTAVDTFIYDTSLDSDGGAWRKRCQHTSWFNEAITGKWLGAHASEFDARCHGATFGLELITNPNFATNTTGWTGTTLTLVSGALQVTGTANPNTTVVFPVVAGKTYVLVVDAVQALTAVAVSIFGASNVQARSASFIGAATHRFAFVSPNTGNGYVSFQNWSGAGFTIDNVSIREVTAFTTNSNDYFQLTTDGKFYRLWKNLLQWSQDFSNPVWTINNITVSSGVADPNGGTSAFTVTATGANGDLYQSLVRSNVNHKNSIWVRRRTGTGVIQIRGPQGQTNENITVTSEWQRFTSNAGLPFQGTGAYAGIAVLTAGDAVDVYGAQLETGTIANTYEAKTTIGTTSEVFRGNRREFPAVALIVAESNKVTIFDADDLTLPMWMVFNLSSNVMIRGAEGGVAMLNGLLVSGDDTNGVSLVNFVSEKANVLTNAYYNRQYDVIVSRNLSSAFIQDVNRSGLVNGACKDVAMTVLPNAPVDAATGLPVPTIRVGTAGGISVINNNNTVTSTAATIYTQSTAKSADYDLWQRYLFGNSLLAGGSIYVYMTSSWYLAVLDKVGNYLDQWAVGDVSEGAPRPDKLTQIAFDPTGAKQHMSCGMTATYCSGWMPALIRGAFLADINATALVGSELVTNGDFSSGATGWTLTGSAAVLDGELVFVGGATGTASFSVGSQPAGSYQMKITKTVLGVAGAANTYIRLLSGSTLVGAYNVGGVNGPLSYDNLVVATSTFDNVSVYYNGASAYEYKFDNISVRLADADRSVHNKSLIVTGTINRTPVATGAELVGYSGFRSSAPPNYLMQPYNSGLDFGTGDFSIMFWVNDPGGSSTSTILHRPGTGSDVEGFSVWRISSSGSRALVFQVGSAAPQAASATPIGVWTHVLMMRKNGFLYIYLNGQLSTVSSVVNTYNVVSDQPLFFGVSSNITGGNSALRYALFRMSATAPTPDQIKKIYEDEVRLFQPGAACTLFGTSDWVTALAHDAKTNLLHVGTSSGRSVFDGLVRVANTTTPVTTAISAVNGLIAEQ